MIKKVAVFAGSRDGASPIFNQHAFELGALLARENCTILFGGGKNGGMGALSKGVASQRGQMEAYIAQAYYRRDEQFPKHIVHTQPCATDAERNKIFMQADFQIALAGGVGSFLEIIDTLNHKVYHDKHSAPLVILSSDGFYKELNSVLSRIINAEFNAPEIQERYTIVENPRIALDVLGLH